MLRDGESSRVKVGRAVSLILEGGGEEDVRVGSRLLLEEIFDAVERGVQHGLGEGPDQADYEAVQADQVVERFLRRKLDRVEGRDFLESLAEASSPASWAFRAAANLAVDALRASGPLRLVRPPDGRRSDCEESGPGLDRYADPDHQWDPAETPGFDQADRRLLATITAEEQILLRLFNCVELTPDQLELLAEKRGVPPGQVLAEVEQRLSTTEARRWELEGKLERRRVRLRSLERRSNLVQDAIRQRNGVATEPSIEPDDPKRCGEEHWLLGARPGERAGCERYIARLLEQQSSLYKRESAKLRDPTTKSPRYREVAQILGRITASSSEQEMASAANTVQVQLNRLRRRLIRARSQGETDER